MEPEGSLPQLQIPPPAPILSHIDLVHAPHPTSWRSISIFYCHLRLGRPSGSLQQVSPPQPCIHCSFPPYMLHAPPIFSRIDHPNNIGWGIQIINSSLPTFLHSIVTSFLLNPNILLSTLFPNTLSLRSPSMWETKFHTHTNQRAKL